MIGKKKWCVVVKEGVEKGRGERSRREAGGTKGKMVDERREIGKPS